MSFPLKLALRIALAWAGVCAVGILAGKPIVDALLPFLRLVTESLSSDFSAALHWDAEAPHMLMIEAQLLNATSPLQAIGLEYGRTITAGTNLEHILVPVVLLYGALLSWPVRNLTQRAVLLVLGVPAALASLALTTPFLLAGKVETLVQSIAVQAGVDRPEPFVLQWMLFTEGGGRWLVPLVLAAVCVLLMQAFMEPQRAAPGRPPTWDEFKQGM